MTRRSTRRSSVAVRRTVLGLMLGIPLVASPVMAQEAMPGDQPVEGEAAVVEQPRVLISEVLIEGLEGHPEEERLQISTYDACLLYTSPSPRDLSTSRMPSSA